MQQHSEGSSTAISTKNDDLNVTKNSNTCEIFRDGCKAIMSILVILTNDCGESVEKNLFFITAENAYERNRGEKRKDVLQKPTII